MARVKHLAFPGVLCALTCRLKRNRAESVVFYQQVLQQRRETLGEGVAEGTPLAYESRQRPPIRENLYVYGLAAAMEREQAMELDSQAQWKQVGGLHPRHHGTD